MANETLQRPQGQKVPDAAQQNPPRRGDEGEEFLIRHGWTKAGIDDRGRSLWNDPKADVHQAVNPRGVKIELPAKDGGTETWYQTSGPILAWTYPLEEAADMQRSRNDEPARLARVEQLKQEAAARARQAVAEAKALKKR